MFDIGWQELLVIAIVLIVVVGPKDLPRMLRAFGKATSRMRSMASDFRTQFDEALREADLDDVRQTISDAQQYNPSKAIREAMSPLRQVGDDIRAGLSDVVKPETISAPVENDVPTVPSTLAGEGETATARSNAGAAKPRPAARKKAKTAAKASAGRKTSSKSTGSSANGAARPAGTKAAKTAKTAKAGGRAASASANGKAATGAGNGGAKKDTAAVEPAAKARSSGRKAASSRKPKPAAANGKTENS